VEIGIWMVMFRKMVKIIFKTMVIPIAFDYSMNMFEIYLPWI
jgi:hypothetical protein